MADESGRPTIERRTIENFHFAGVGVDDNASPSLYQYPLNNKLNCALVLFRWQMTVFGNNAVENLQSCWLVGVVEQYAGLLEVLRRLIDPGDDYPLLWQESHGRQENK